MIFFCNKECGKSDFDELRFCRNLKREHGLRTCLNKQLNKSRLLCLYEYYFPALRTIDHARISDCQYLFFCKKCNLYGDWANCSYRKGDHCTSLEKLKETLTDRIKELFPNIFENEAFYEEALSMMKSMEPKRPFPPNKILGKTEIGFLARRK